MLKVNRFDTVSANSSTTRIFLKDSRVQKRHQNTLEIHRFIMNFKYTGRVFIQNWDLDSTLYH
jgi:hypothetical protein